MKPCCIFAVFAAIYAQGQIPRLTDGSPDLGADGVWLPRAVPDIAFRNEVPFQPWAKLRFLENAAAQSNDAAKSNDTALRCLPPGVPRITFQPRPFQIVQTPGRILFIYEGGAHVWRQVWMDGRARPKDPNPNWLGHSIGHWEGSALVVDSIGFNDRTWLDDAGHPHTEQLHVIEKYTRIDVSTMKYDVVIDDPGAYTQAWTSSSNLLFHPGEKPAEDICLDKISR